MKATSFGNNSTVLVVRQSSGFQGQLYKQKRMTLQPPIKILRAPDLQRNPDLLDRPVKKQLNSNFYCDRLSNKRNSVIT